MTDDKDELVFTPNNTISTQISFGPTNPALLIFADTLQLGNIVKISLKDGSVTRLDDYTSDEEAARQFWLAVEDWKKLLPT